MKFIIMFCFAFVQYQLLNAQGFELSLDTNYKTCRIGDKAEFTISISPETDFNSTIILRSESLENNLSFSENYLNPPYKKSKFIIDTKEYFEGTKIFKLYGISGNKRSDVVCTLEVKKNLNWTKLKSPWFEWYDGVENKYLGFLKDQDDNITVSGRGNGIMLSKFINQKWEFSSVQTNAYTNGTYTIGFNGDSIWHTSYEGLVLAENGNVKIFNSKNSEIGEGEPFFVLLDNMGNPFVIRENMFKSPNIFKFSYFHDGYWDILDEEKYTVFGYRIWEDTREMLNAAVVDKNNSIWFINKFNKLFKLDNENGILKIEEKNILNKVDFKYEKLYKDNEHNLWINDTLNKVFYNYKNDSLYKIEYPLNYGKAINVVFKNLNEVWYSTNKGLVHYKDSSFSLYKREDIPSLVFGSSAELIIDKHDNLWIRNYNEILVFNPNGLVEIPIVSSIEGDIEENTSLIYPNPASETIALDLDGVEFADLVIYDILGNEIMSIPNYSNKSEIGINNLSIGSYTIQIKTNTGSISQRLVINR